MKTQHYVESVYLDAARDFLSPHYQRIPDQQVAGILFDALEQMSPMERDAFANLSMQYAGENFWNDLGRGISQVASKALPYIAPVAKVAAPLIGTVVGGPVGGAIGGQLAGLLGQVAAPRSQPSRPVAQTPVARRPLAAPPPPASGTTNPAATQLMSLLGNPQMLQALLGQVLGTAGNNTANIASNPQQSIPFGGMMSTLSELALRAAEESVRLGNSESENYLRDGYGNYRMSETDNPATHADIVMGILEEDHAWRTAENIEDNYENEYDSVTSWFIEAGLVR